MNTFVEVDWLRAHLEDANLRVVDARSMPHGVPDLGFPTGQAQYAEGHIPGAIHLDYMDDLSDPATPYAARIAPPERFAQIFGERGLGDDATIVAYDNGDIPYAARMVWMCRYYGHDDVHILAGGLKAWKAAGEPVTSVPGSYPPATFTPRPRHTLRASRDEVLGVAEGRHDAQLLETQRERTYNMRDRDIKGARRLSAARLLEDANGGRVAPPETLRALVAELGLDPRKRTIVSCGSGVSASGSYVALVSAGFEDVAVYDGSWMEWSHDALPTVPKPAR